MSISLWTDEQERPLQHLRVIDLTVMFPGPYLTRLLAQYGADVIKVEAIPGGDPLRQHSNTALFELLNQGKRSVAVNLKSEQGAFLVRQLAGEADLFVENYREGVMDSMGLGYAELSEENPDLLYLSIRGFKGKGGVRAGHDLNFVAASGVGEWFLGTGTPNYSAQFGEIIGGTLVPAVKLLFHLANPNRRGMHLVTTMDESFRTLYLGKAYDLYRGESLGEEQRKNFGYHRSLDGLMPHSRYYRCRDNQWVSLNAVQKKHWDAFCEVVDREAWKERMGDPALVPEVEKLLQTAPATYWEALTQNRELCLFRVVPWAEHLDFSQARPQLSSDPLTWAGFAPNPALKSVPNLGHDTFAVFNSMGISNKDLSDWLSGGILLQGDKG